MKETRKCRSSNASDSNRENEMTVARDTPHSSSRDHVVSTNVSQSTRRDSRPPILDKELRDVFDEYEYLTLQLATVDQELSQYNSSRMLKEQQKCRRENRGNSLNAWIDRKAELSEERRLLVEKKLRMQSRRVAIKPKALSAKNLLHKAEARGEDSSKPLFAQMVDLLTEIRDLLKTKNA
jgi:hypothetical protein